MKTKAIRLAAACLTASLLLCGALNVTAAKYVENVVADFEAAADCKFLAPGDLNADGAVNADDAVSMRKLLMTDFDDSAYDAVYTTVGKDAKYSDVNGDAVVDLKDLVRQKKNAVENFEFVTDGAMSINGNSAYNGDFISVLGTGATYEISYSYKSDAPIKVVINGLGEEIVYENQAAAELTSVTYNLKTPLSIGESGGIELQIIGVGTVDGFTVTRVNMDNVIENNW